MGGALNPFFITGSSLNPVQELNVPELVQGRYTPYLWNWGKIETGGNVTGPVFEGAAGMGSGGMFQWAAQRSTMLDHMTRKDLEVDIAYYKGVGRKFTNVSINSFEVTVTAGDVANFTVDFMGAGSAGAGGSAAYDLSGSAGSATRLVTWDICSFTGYGGSGAIQGFNFTLANNLQRAYAVGAPHGEGYAPFDVVAGIQKLTGTLTVYAGEAPGMNDSADNWGTSTAAGTTCSFIIGSGAAGGGNVIDSGNFQALLKRAQASAKTDTTTYTVDYQAIAFDGSAGGFAPSDT